MSQNKLKFHIYLFMKYKKLRFYLYLIAAALVLIPTFIALFLDITFTSLFSKIVISISFILIFIGKLITIIEKKNTDLPLHKDIGIIIGLSLAFILYILKVI